MLFIFGLVAILHRNVFFWPKIFYFKTLITVYLTEITHFWSRFQH